MLQVQRSLCRRLIGPNEQRSTAADVSSIRDDLNHKYTQEELSKSQVPQVEMANLDATTEDQTEDVETDEGEPETKSL